MLQEAKASKQTHKISINKYKRKEKNKKLITKYIVITEADKLYQ
jgi:hypothetical protein